ncbi:trypsin-like serine protease [Amycolatopsis sp. TNS106]|uniref:trypsin-like serine protease n=1 Tax=Amycolatopsis sp. TNS106 TaxID=2861750 RepID=UPI001C570BA2|nr:trypsin-like serine protease [Amycolatopsis sp. TNS106]
MRHLDIAPDPRLRHSNTPHHNHHNAYEHCPRQENPVPHTDLDPEFVEPLRYYQEDLEKLSCEPQAQEATEATPWIASFMFNCDVPKKVVDGYRAAAVLIDPCWLLTCGHVFGDIFRPEDAPKFEDLDLYVRIGGQQLGTGTVHRFDKVVTNRFRMKDRSVLWGPVNDLALVRLTEPADAEPAVLADFHGLRVGHRIRAYGWPDGRRGTGRLTRVDTEVIPPESCIGMAPGPGDACVANVASAPMRPGYSGGPAFLLPDGDTSAAPLLTGVVSRGIYGQPEIFPGVVTDLTAHLPFIRATIAGNH